MFTYQLLAKQVINGNYNLADGFYYQPFFYTIYLPLIYKWFGINYFSYVIVQCIAGAGVIWLTGVTAAREFGKISGLIAAFLIATCQYHIFFTPFTLIAVLQSFWIILLLYLTLTAYKNKKLKSWMLVGIVHGFAVVTRGNALCFTPIILVMLFHSLHRNKKKTVYSIGLYLGMAIMVQLPYSIINFQNEGNWVGASTAGPAVLALGNTPESPPGGREERAGAGPMEYPPSYHEWMRMDNLDDNNKISVSRNIVNWIKREPFAFLELKFRMFLLFWSQSEIPNNVAMSNNNQAFRVLHWPIFFRFLFIGSLGITGIILTVFNKRRNLREQSFAWFTLLYMIATVAFYILARFRVPILPVLCILGSIPISQLLRQIKKKPTVRQKRVGAFTLATLLFSIGFVGWGSDIYRFCFESAIIKMVRPSGTHISLETEDSYKDHGPQSFGGWFPQQLEKVKKIDKVFVIDDQFDDKNRTRLRFPLLYVESQQQELILVLKQDSRSVSKTLPIKSGFQWVDIDIQNSVEKSTDNTMYITLEFPGNTNGIHLIFDIQRYYERSIINGRPNKDIGEWVAELRISK